MVYNLKLIYCNLTILQLKNSVLHFAKFILKKKIQKMLGGIAKFSG